MAAKLLHSLTDENLDLQKQIGCMTGIFQLFDRQNIVTGGGRRVVSHGSKRLPHGNSYFRSSEIESYNTHLRSASTAVSDKTIQEKQRISSESSRPSFSSSSRSSSFSSLDCNRATTQLEPSSYERIIFPESPSRDPSMSFQISSPKFSRQSFDIRDLVKDSMYREVPALSTKAKTIDESPPRPRSKTSSDLKGSLEILAKLHDDAPRYQHGPRELLRSASFHAKEGSSFSVSRDAPRFSYDGREVNRAPFFDASKSTLKIKDFPRLSLDGRESSTRGTYPESKSEANFELDRRVQNLQQIPGYRARPPSVVAKLMGLEALPDSTSSSNDEDFVDAISRSSSKSDHQSSVRTSSSSMKPMSRFPIEPAPWKQIESAKSSPKPKVTSPRAIRAQPKASTTFPSVYSEIEKRLKDLEFTRSGKDLRALKQILEAMQSKGFLKTEKESRGSNEQKHSSHEAIRSVNSNQKQVLDSTKRRTTRHYESSPIVIMKPAKPVKKSANKDNERSPKMTHTSSRLPQLTKDSNVGSSGKSSGSVSPRMQQKKIELEKRSRPPTPPDSSNSRRHTKKQQTESNSPGGRRRTRHQPSGDQPSEVNVESRYMNYHENESSSRSSESITRSSKMSDLVDKKSTLVMSEEESGEFDVVPPEYSSPVSVLDKIVYRDDSPSPLKYAGKTVKADASVDKEMDSTTESEMSRKKLENIENLVQKLRRLNSTHDEAHTDYIASLCENANPDHRYISEILLASGLLLRELGSSLANFQFHPSGHPINPELFLVLEQTKASALLVEQPGTEKISRSKSEGKFHRKLIFDAVNEILAVKFASTEPWLRSVKQVGKRAATINAQKLLSELCSEIEQLQMKNPKCGSDDEEDERAWRDILFEDVMHGSENWIYFDGEISGAVLDIERSIFKGLVNEIVIGESGCSKIKPGRRDSLRNSSFSGCSLC